MIVSDLLYNKVANSKSVSIMINSNRKKNSGRTAHIMLDIKNVPLASCLEP